MLIAHLLASPFYGGPERQVLSLAREMRENHDSLFLSFAENGLARPFLNEASAAGFQTIELKENWPNVLGSVREIAARLSENKASLLCTSGYKPDILGLWAARRTNIPALAIAHGWTGATRKVRVNEMLDRWILKKYDAVVSVSQSQAEKVRRAGVSPDRMVTISNAVNLKQAKQSSVAQRQLLESYFPRPPRLIVAAAGRLSPEKGFDVFLEAASRLVSQFDEVGFILFGEGPQRPILENAIKVKNLENQFVLAGFHSDLDQFLPNFDVLVLSSFTEGLPVILLEALAAGVPVVATKVGGIPEVIVEGVYGLLVPAGDADALAAGIANLLKDSDLRESMKIAGPARIASKYSTAIQAEQYQAIFARLLIPLDESDKSAR